MAMDLPTYNDVMSAIAAYVMNDSIPKGKRDLIDRLSNEYSEVNHSRKLSAASMLFALETVIDEDGVEGIEVPTQVSREIFQIGMDIHNEGGLDAQQACYLIAKKFIRPVDPTSLERITAIEGIWDGAGKWQS